MSFIPDGEQVFDIEIEALQEVRARIDKQFSHACELIKSCRGRVVVTGMGKSGHIANKIAASLASTGTPAFFVHPGTLGRLESRQRTLNKWSRSALEAI